jgi:hypothetical protein
VLGYLLAWMAYRQYFPAISTAEGGRPYSIAEFATDSAERPSQSYTTSSSYNAQEPDLELGQPRQRARRTEGTGTTGHWDGMDTDTEEEGPRNGGVKLGHTEQEYGTIPGQQAGTQSFDGNTARTDSRE